MTVHKYVVLELRPVIVVDVPETVDVVNESALEATTRYLVAFVTAFQLNVMLDAVTDVAASPVGVASFPI